MELLFVLMILNATALFFMRYVVFNPERIRRMNNRELDMKPPYQFDEEDSDV